MLSAKELELLRRLSKKHKLRPEDLSLAKKLARLGLVKMGFTKDRNNTARTTPSGMQVLRTVSVAKRPVSRVVHGAWNAVWNAGK